MTLSGLVDIQAQQRPHATAVVDADQTWSYGDVAEQRGRLSAALLALGIEPGSRVGVYCNKGAAGFIAMHAIVSIGAVAVPLDPGSPVTRLASICERMQVDVVISHSPRTESVVALHEMRPLRGVIGVELSIADCPGSEFVGPETLSRLDPVSPRSVAPDSPSYIITTSGTTGEPKGIVHTHRSACAYAQMGISTFSLTAADRVSDIAPYHFDISTQALWTVPLVGATNVVVSEPYQRLPASHSQLLQDQQVSVWYSVPFLLKQLVTRGALDDRDLRALRWVQFGGEVISAETIAALMKHCPNARFANVFGPAETNHCTTAIFDAPPQDDSPVSIGFPVENTEVLVLEPTIEIPEEPIPVDSGELGELWVNTPQLMDGYWGLPEENNRVFLDVDDKRFYRTGDLVSADVTGELAFHGRRDNQVKVRGFRIELEGVEQALEELGFAEHVVVGVHRAESSEDELVAGVLGESDDFNSADFIGSAASVLPSYAVPTQTVRLDSPLFTGSGKLDRRALREQAARMTP